MKKFLICILIVIVAFILGYAIQTMKLNRVRAQNENLSKKVENLRANLDALKLHINTLEDENSIKSLIFNLYMEFENRNFGTSDKILSEFEKNGKKFYTTYPDSEYGKRLKDFFESDKFNNLKNLVQKGDLKTIKDIEEIILPLLK